MQSLQREVAQLDTRAKQRLSTVDLSTSTSRSSSSDDMETISIEVSSQLSSPNGVEWPGRGGAGEVATTTMPQLHTGRMGVEMTAGPEDDDDDEYSLCSCLIEFVYNKCIRGERTEAASAVER